MNALPWIILFLPALAAAMIALFTQRNQKLSAGLSVGAVLAGFVLSLIFIKATHGASIETSARWLGIDTLQIDFGIRLDALSEMMLLVVTGVASAIHIYSMAYMEGDRSYSRFFACMSLFTFSMLGIVVANNFVQLFIFWELVGVSSYLLIGFWYERPSAADAAKKAFLTNRIGDFGFLLGILATWGFLGSLNFTALQEKLSEPHDALAAIFLRGDLGISREMTLTAIGLLIFCGAVGKSAQFPLHVWLPDAMEGPTPVSALIHAATMVAAGVYMLCRVFFLLNAPALEVISYVGGFTALLAALIAVQQNDIKRILAYSTLSQLGYMVMAVGLHGPGPAMFHLTTHAFFKALLFLGAGSVIIALHHEQDIWNMGALRKKMPVTFWTFMAGTLALTGLWPFSGFFSKDNILAQALERNNFFLFFVGGFVAFLTAFYMFRLIYVVFCGSTRAKGAEHAHESSPTMLWPLRVLAVFSIFGGVIGIEAAFNSFFGKEDHPASFGEQLVAPFAHAPVAAIAGILALALGWFVARKFYSGATADPLPVKLGSFARAMRNRFYLDELYEATVIRLHETFAGIAAWIDRWIIEGICVGLVRGGTDLAGRALRMTQSGNVQTYAFLFALGVALVLWLVVGR